MSGFRQFASAAAPRGKTARPQSRHARGGESVRIARSISRSDVVEDVPWQFRSPCRTRRCTPISCPCWRIHAGCCGRGRGRGRGRPWPPARRRGARARRSRGGRSMRGASFGGVRARAREGTQWRLLLGTGFSGWFGTWLSSKDNGAAISARARTATRRARVGRSR